VIEVTTARLSRSRPINGSPVNQGAIFTILSTLLVVSGCGVASSSYIPLNQPLQRTPLSPKGTMDGNAASWSAKIKHVVIIFQENRTMDNLFNGYPGADTQSWGLDHNGNRVSLSTVSMTAPYDVSHNHDSFVTEYAGGNINGFDLVNSRCNNSGFCPPPEQRAYAKVPRSESKPYWDMAKQWVLGDRMFQTNQGPSFPAHQYIISGTSTIENGSPLRAADNPKNPAGGGSGGCESPAGTKVRLIDEQGHENQTAYPCFKRTTLGDLLDAKALSWGYYEEKYGAGLWYAFDAIDHIYRRPDYRSVVVAPADRVLEDALNCSLRSVTWVTPAADDSDHARITDGSGPSWVAAIVNAIGESKDWKSTAIFVTWDDWGGWYDHVSPPMYDSYELGFRVPLLVISPYAKEKYVSHQQYEFGSILKFTEETFGLGSLNTTDTRADDLSDCFDFNQAPRKFHRIRAPLGPRYFMRRRRSSVNPDDDF
jgi:phospholipase C